MVVLLCDQWKEWHKEPRCDGHYVCLNIDLSHNQPIICPSRQEQVCHFLSCFMEHAGTSSLQFLYLTILSSRHLPISAHLCRRQSCNDTMATPQWPGWYRSPDLSCDGPWAATSCRFLKWLASDNGCVGNTCRPCGWSFTVTRKCLTTLRKSNKYVKRIWKATNKVAGGSESVEC